MEQNRENKWKGTMLDRVPDPIKYKCGDEHPSGFIFWSYSKNCRNGMRLVTLEKYKELKSKGKDAANKRVRERTATDPLFRLKKRVRARLSEAFRNNGYSKTTKTCEMLGCTFEELKGHIERQFQDGMTWENMGQWHIDHVLPLAAATTLEDMLKLAHYTNLQPLWAEDNLNKRDSYDAQELDEYLSR